MNCVWEEGFLPCKYTARMVNAEGMFYEGDDTCIWQTMNRIVIGGSPYRGGIFVLPPLEDYHDCTSQV